MKKQTKANKEFKKFLASLPTKKLKFTRKEIREIVNACIRLYKND